MPSRLAQFLTMTVVLVTTATTPSLSDVAETRDADSSIPHVTEFRPNSVLDFVIPKTTSAPIINGKLDDTTWATAKKLSNFVEITPGDNVEPAVQTDVLITYDDVNLYLGFVCYEENIDNIRATITDRDNIGRDDFAGIMIDTFNDNQTSYEFFVNPFGIQFDQRRSKSDEDESFDTVWDSAGEINELGWTAEISIPFRSLRFPNVAEQQWGVHFLRVRPRDSREQHSWAPVSRDESCLLCQAGTMGGLENVNAGRNLEVLPYLISNRQSQLEDSDDPNSSFNSGSPEFDAGFGVKYGVTPNVILDATLNPDFSQVESDAAQISLNTTSALFLDERRPFFLEGIDIFDSNVEAVYTRSINNPIAAGKLTGKEGKYTVGYIIAQDDATSYVVPFEEGSELVLGGQALSNIARIKRDLWSDSFIGLMATDRRYNDGSNTTVGFDYDLRFKEQYRLTTQVMGSYTKEPNDSTLSEDFNGSRFGPPSDNKRYTSDFDGENFTGHAIVANFRRNARHWNFFSFYESHSPTFRADNGFIGSNNFRLAGIWNGVVFRPEDNRLFEVLEPGFGIGRKYNYDGVFKDEWIEPQLFLRFKKQTWMFASYIWSQERFKGVHIDGIRRLFLEMGTDFSQYFTAEAWVRFGRSIFRSDDPFLASEWRSRARLELKPTSQIKFDTVYQIATLSQLDDGPMVPHEDHKQYSVRNRLTYQFNKRLFVRLVGQYGKEASEGGSYTVDPLVSYKINPFTVFFLGSSHSFLDFGGVSTGDKTDFRKTEQTFFIKFQYLFRV